MLTRLTQLLNGWTRWMRLQTALLWALRGLLIGLGLALVLGVPAMLSAWLLRAEFLTWAASLALGTALTGALIAFIRPLGLLEAARRIDRLLGLDERVSTALEVDPLLRASSPLLRRQLEDSIFAAEKVRPPRDLPLRLKRTEGLLALLLVALIALTWWRGEPWFQAAVQRRAVQQAIAAQAANIEEILPQIQENEALTEEQRQALLQPLEEALHALQDDPSLEGSVSILTDSGEQLEALADPQAAELFQALQESGRQMSSQEDGPLQSVGEELAQGDILNAAEQLANLDAGELSPSEAGQAAEQLGALAESLADSDPQLAEALEQAAQALEQGDAAAAQQALDEAARQMAEAGQQVAFSEAASQAARELQEGASQLVAAGGGGQNSQAGQGTPGASDQAGQGTGSAGAGRGSDSGTQNASTGGEAGSAPIPQNNGAGDGGLTSYEQIYAPTLLDGEPGAGVALPDSGEDGSVVGESPNTATEEGQSLVPYTDVYAQYADLFQQAIENGEVPVEFLDIVRDYFDSVSP